MLGLWTTDKLFYYPHQHGADEATSSASDSALPPPPTEFKKKEVVRVWCRAIKMFRDLEHMSFKKRLREVCLL